MTWRRFSLKALLIGVLLFSVVSYWLCVFIVSVNTQRVTVNKLASIGVKAIYRIEDGNSQDLDFFSAAFGEDIIHSVTGVVIEELEPKSPDKDISNFLELCDTLQSLKQLRSIDVGDIVLTADDILCFNKLTSLTELKLGGAIARNDCLAEIANMNNISALTVGLDFQADTKSIQLLSTMSLCELTLYHSNLDIHQRPRYHYSACDLRALSTMRLTKLSLNGLQLSKSDFLVVCGLGDLEELELNSVDHKECEFSDFRQLKKIRKLRLKNCRVTDSDISNIFSINSLRELEVYALNANDEIPLLTRKHSIKCAGLRSDIKLVINGYKVMPSGQLTPAR